MKTTIEYFKMSKEELIKVINEYNYTREEAKILDDGIRVTFYENKDEYKMTIEEDSKWYKNNSDLEITETLLMLNGNIAVVYN